MGISFFSLSSVEAKRKYAQKWIWLSCSTKRPNLRWTHFIVHSFDKITMSCFFVSKCILKIPFWRETDKATANQLPWILYFIFALFIISFFIHCYVYAFEMLRMRLTSITPTSECIDSVFIVTINVSAVVWCRLWFYFYIFGLISKLMFMKFSSTPFR